MVCWLVLLCATSVTWLLRKIGKLKGNEGFWLNIMFLGGTIFGLIDHLWNGEIFLIGNIFSDLTLGGVITGGIFGSWVAITKYYTQNIKLNVHVKSIKKI